MDIRHRYVSLLLLSVAACSSAESSKPDAPREVVAVAKSALTASTTASQALPGRVNAVPGVLFGGSIAAATTGAWNVEDDGSTTYRVPVWVPEGVNGLHPSLAILYDSSSSSSTLGPRWRISGLSTIVRCARTLSADGVQRPVELNGDSFCMGDDRFVRVSGNGNAAGEFRLEVNPFQKIVATAGPSGTTTGIVSFKIFQADGRIFHYGRTPAARLNRGGSGETYAYYLDKIQDRYDNTILITYRSRPEVCCGTAEERVPDTITWGATGDSVGQRKVKFVYEHTGSYVKSVRSVAGFQIAAPDRLSALEMYGPDGLGSTVFLKKYTFTYTKPSITGDRLLSKVFECDINNVCKRPTVITWDAGTLAHTRKVQPFSDPALAGAPIESFPSGNFSQSNLYRRIIAVDLNNDGRDDLVYRNYASPGCLTWYARWNTSSGTNVSFGERFQLPGAADSDPACAGVTNLWAYSGDAIFADMNLDDYPDILIGRGNNGSKDVRPLSSQLAFNAYRYYAVECPVPGGLANCWGTSGPIDFEDPAKVNVKNPWLSVGDITGDGFPELLRPRPSPSSGLHWKTGIFGASGDIGAMTGTSFTGMQLMDLDGDGTQEVIRDKGTVSGQFVSNVTSPSINGDFVTIPPINPGSPPQTLRWLLDLNGDGLVDVATVDRASLGTIATRLALGKDFSSPAKSVTLPAGFNVGGSWLDGFESGVRVVDFNLDGRQDLMLVDKGQNSSSSSTRSMVKVLLSDGLGGFTFQDTTLPIGDFADGAATIRPSSSPAPATPDSHGYRTTVPFDFNGDGLPDLIQIEAGTVVTYLRQGKRPDLVTRITEGTGRQLDVTYAPPGDTAVYTKDPSSCHGNADPQRRLTCLVRNRWLTKQVAEKSLELPSVSVTRTTRFSYTAGLFDRFGRGFLGFKRRDIYEQSSRRTAITYDPHFVASAGAAYLYPLALKPVSVTIDVDTSASPNNHQQEVRTFTSATSTFVNSSRFTVLLTGATTKIYDCVANGAGGCSGTRRLLSSKDETFSYDQLLAYNAMGRPIRHTLTYRDGSGAALRTDVTGTSFTGFDPANWLMPVGEVKLTSTSTSISPAETVTRTTKYTPDPVINAATGLLTGEPKLIEIEPTGAAATRRQVTLVRDGRGRLTAIQDMDFSKGSTRRSTYDYEDADGVYATTTTNPMGHKTRVWRHPGFGFVVEVDDPNQLAVVTSYDTFGRVTHDQQLSGASTSYTYEDAADPVTAGGVNVTVSPEGSTTRKFKVHLDSMGRETLRTLPVDATRAVSVQSTYDAFGRLGRRLVKTGSTTSQTTIVNDYTYNYDDLDRLLSDCHFSGDGVNRCKTNQHDGLSTWSADESGRSVTHVEDALGRPSIQRAALRTGVSDAIFVYGAFGLLRRQLLSDGSPVTEMNYDVLGRKTSLTRTGAGMLSTAYDAYGDVVSTSRHDQQRAIVESIEYTRDALGRLTKITSGGTNPIRRALKWDRSVQSPGTPAPFAIGKLVDVLDGWVDGTDTRSAKTIVHYDYEPKGLQKQTWTALMWTQQQQLGTVQYAYDSQGRVQTLTYPSVAGWSNPLSLNYAYDQFTGDVASITDTANSATPLWKATTRNAIGQVSGEAMKLAAGPTLTRTTNYHLQNGLPSTAALTGTNGQAQLDYAYLPNLLPSAFSMSGVGGAWTSTFDYDNLSRLTHWSPTPDVALEYRYDAHGALTSRFWSSASTGFGETASYSVAPSPSGGYTQTITVSGTGFPQYTANFEADQWGRTLDTPDVALTYNAADEVIGVFEKDGGRSNQLLRDGLGGRIATTYGSPTSGQPYGSLISLGDLFESKFSNVSGNEERCRVFAAGRLVGEVTRTSNTPTRSATFYLTDNVGSVVAEASSSGTVTARARRDPYGNGIFSFASPNLPGGARGTNPDGTSRLAFGGHEREVNWGLIDMNARLYSPRLGRFISADSVIANTFDRRDYNPFAYVQNNPTTLHDPTGHFGCSSSGCGGPAPGDGGGGPSGPTPGDNGDSGGGNMSMPPSVWINGPMSGGSPSSETPSSMSSQAPPSVPPPPQIPFSMYSQDGASSADRAAASEAARADAMNGVQGPPPSSSQVNSGSPPVNYSSPDLPGSENFPNPVDMADLTPRGEPTIDRFPGMAPSRDRVYSPYSVATAFVSYNGTIILGPVGGYANVGVGFSAHRGLEFHLSGGIAGGLAAGFSHGIQMGFGTATSWETGITAGGEASLNAEGFGAGGGYALDGQTSVSPPVKFSLGGIWGVYGQVGGTISGKIAGAGP